MATNYGVMEEDPLLPRSRRESKAATTYDATTGAAMFVNFIVGTGCFALPFAFAQAGLAFSSILLLLGGGLCAISGLYTLEVMARGEGVLSAKTGEKPENVITERKVDFSELSQIFGGRIMRSVTQLMIFMFGTPWSYAGVFASSVAALVFSYLSEHPCDVYHHPNSECRAAYYGLLAVFGVCGVTFAMMDVSEQAGVQRFMTLYRGAAFVIMILTLSFKVYMEWDLVPDRVAKIGWFNFAQFAAIFGPSFQALANQYNMPDLIPPLRNKMDAPFVTNASFAICAVFYMMVAILGAIGFDRVDPLVSLNWASYTGCGTGWDACPQHASPLTNVMQKIIGSIIRILVLCFPVVNVSSAYPLVCVTVGDNMSTLVPDSVRSALNLGTMGLKRLCRFVAALCPLLVAASFMPLDLIFTIAGVFGFILSLTIPSFLQLLSINYLETRYGPGSATTPYTTPILSSKAFTWTFFLLSCACVVLSVATMGKK